MMRYKKNLKLCSPLQKCIEYGLKIDQQIEKEWPIGKKLQKKFIIAKGMPVKRYKKMKFLGSKVLTFMTNN